jgi:hypothetical protein
MLNYKVPAIFGVPQYPLFFSLTPNRSVRFQVTNKETGSLEILEMTGE